MYAIWLLPDEKDTKYLKKIIEKFSLKFNSPKFIPHITVYGLVDFELSTIKNGIKKFVDEVEPFIVKKSGIKISDNIWKSMFIELEKNDELIMINNKLNSFIGENKKFEFSPHISLIYKKMSKTEKLKILESLNIKNKFEIDKIAIQKFSDKINEWKIIQIFNL